MSFKIVVVSKDDDGAEVRDVIHETKDEDGRVIKVRVLTRRGESATIPVEPDEGDIALTFEYLPAGALHVSDVDLLKPGYLPNQSGDDVKATEAKLVELRGTQEASETFTQEAADAQAEAEKANAGDPEVEETKAETKSTTKRTPAKESADA